MTSLGVCWYRGVVSIYGSPELAQDMRLYLLVRSAPLAFWPARLWYAWYVYDVYHEYGPCMRDAIIMNSVEAWVYHIVEIEV